MQRQSHSKRDFIRPDDAETKEGEKWKIREKKR